MTIKHFFNKNYKKNGLNMSLFSIISITIFLIYSNK